MDVKLLGLRIKAVREERQLSIDEVANAIGVNKSTISRYERGEIVNPKIPVVDAIANFLCVNPAWLLGKDPNRTFTPKGTDLSAFVPCNMFPGLRSIRESFGYSTEEVAFQIGISEKDYEDIENGCDTSCIILARLAVLFCCSTDHVLSFDGVFGSSDVPVSRSPSMHLAATPIAFTRDEQEFILKYRRLDARGQAAVTNVLEHEYNSLPGDKAPPAPKEA